MSYEYAKIPLASGLNIICGPNGSGKSSILLAISVALGQAYTERGGKLSDLIRWGENTARVTLTFDNTLLNGKRSIGKFDSDQVRLTRYIQNDGNYWFEANFQAITKAEVVTLLSELGINPNNMILIMHQHMMTEFSVTSAQQKLHMIEEAVGFNEYRNQVLEAQNKLTKVLSEEESISTLLNNAEQNLAYWKDEYDKYQRKKDLLNKKNFLEQENIWAQLIKQEKTLDALNELDHEKNIELTKKIDEIKNNTAIIKKLEENLRVLRKEHADCNSTLLILEKDKIKTQQIISSLNNAISSDLLSSFQQTEIDSAPISEEKIYEAEKYTLDENLELIKKFNQIQFNFQNQTQLLEHNTDKLETAKNLLENLIQDKNTKNTILLKEKERFNELSSILPELIINLENHNKLKEKITLQENQINNLRTEIKYILKQLPSTLNIRKFDDSIDVKPDLVELLQNEILILSKKIGLIDKTKKNVQFLIDEEQKSYSSIKILENELEKLSKKSKNVNLFMEGKEQEFEIKCDKCGSLINFNQLRNYSSEITNQSNEFEITLSGSKEKLEAIQKRLVDEKSNLASLHKDEEVLQILESTLNQTKKRLNDINDSENELKTFLDEQKNISNYLVKLIGVNESTLNNTINKCHEIRNEFQSLKIRIPKLESDLSKFDDKYIKQQTVLVNDTSEVLKKCQESHLKTREELNLIFSEVRFQIDSVSRKRSELDDTISKINTESETIGNKINLITTQYQDEKSKELLLKSEQEKLKNEINKIEQELIEVNRELLSLQELASKSGPRINTERSPLDILTDLKTINANLAILSNISKDTEEMYYRYLNVFNELKQKVMIVSDNREKTLIEVDERKEVWRKILKQFLEEVNMTFRAFLENVNATGLVKLVNLEDLQTAGIELVVGFKGAKPQILDSHTHSGGERSTATMALLLALQRHIKSPFRAVDEFDVHMDPRNRELISLMLLNEMQKQTENQYITITPGQVTGVSESVNVITVQSVQGKSEVKVMT